MFAKIFIAFVVIPIFDLYLLVQIGSDIGVINAIGLCLLTAFIGASLARSQGMATMQKVRENMDKGRMPAEEILDAVIIFAAGLVLLTPGFITDTLGLLLLFPLTRGYFKRWMRFQMEEWMKRPNVHMSYHGPEFRAWTNKDQTTHKIEKIIDVKAEDKDKTLK